LLTTSRGAGVRTTVTDPERRAGVHDRSASRASDAVTARRRVLVAAAAVLAVSAVVALGHELLGPRASHRSAPVPVATWLVQTPAVGSEVRLLGTLTVETTVTLPLDVQPPPGVSIDRPRWIERSGEPYTLAVVKAAEGRRLVLVPPWARTGLPWTEVRGVTLATRDVGIPRAVLDRLRARMPDLDTTRVTCDGWRPAEAADGGAAWPWLAGALLAGAGAIGAFVAARSTRGSASMSDPRRLIR
jgi:hypothetical protein